MPQKVPYLTAQDRRFLMTSSGQALLLESGVVPGPGPNGTQILDNFNRADENPIAGGWGGVIWPSPNGLQVVSHVAQGSSASSNNQSYFNTAYTNSQEAFCTANTDSDIRLFLRVQNPATVASSYYMCQFFISSNQINFYGEDNNVGGGTETFPIFGYTPVHGTLATGVRVGARVSGDSSTDPTLYAYVDYGAGWVLETTGVDSGTTTNLKGSGMLGAMLYDDDSGRTFDDFGGGNV